MNLREIENTKEKLLKGMIDYLKEYGGEGYKKSDVKSVENILGKFSKGMGLAKENEKDYLAIVKETIESLNELNEKCDCCLIETDQREYICEIIIQTALHYGYIEEEIDVTEEWREW